MSFDCQIPCALSFNIAMLYLPIDGALTVARDLWLSYSLCAFVGFTAGLSSAIRKRQTKGGARDELVLCFFVFLFFVFLSFVSAIVTDEFFAVFSRRGGLCCLSIHQTSFFFVLYTIPLSPSSQSYSSYRPFSIYKAHPYYPLELEPSNTATATETQTKTPITPTYKMCNTSTTSEPLILSRRPRPLCRDCYCLLRSCCNGQHYWCARCNVNIRTCSCCGEPSSGWSVNR